MMIPIHIVGENEATALKERTPTRQSGSGTGVTDVSENGSRMLR